MPQEGASPPTTVCFPMQLKQCRSCGVEKPLSEFYVRNPDCKGCTLLKRKEDYRKNRDKYRSKELKKNYGITLEEYNLMFAEQDGCCAICGTHQCSTGKSLAVDHDHISGQIRGLLCANCNTALGKLNDDIETILRAADYLRLAQR